MTSHKLPAWARYELAVAVAVFVTSLVGGALYVRAAESGRDQPLVEVEAPQRHFTRQSAVPATTIPPRTTAPAETTAVGPVGCATTDPVRFPCPPEVTP